MINENMPALYSCSNYGSMKLASEAMLSSFSYLNNVKSFIFRLPNVVGEKLTHGVIFDLSNKIKNKKKVSSSSWKWKTTQTLFSWI